MPISAPPPSWASIKNKPTTVSGFGITDMGSQSVASATNANNVPWSGVSGKPTTVSGYGISDIPVNAISSGAYGIGARIIAAKTNSGTTATTAGETIAGSSLRNGNTASGLSSVINGFHYANAYNLSLSGTWKAEQAVHAGANVYGDQNWLVTTNWVRIS